VAITFVAAGAAAEASWIGTSPLAVAVPSGVTAGYLLMMFSCRTGTSGAGAYVTPSGWTNIAALTMSTGTAARHSFAAYRVAGSSEPVSYNLTTLDGSNIENWGAVMIAYRGVDSSTQLDATSVGDITQGDTNNGDPPSITTVTNSAWVVCFNYVRTGGNDLTAFTPPTGYTERVDTASSTLFEIGIADKEVAVAGAENPGAFTTGGAGSVNDHIVGTLALRPAAAPGGGTAPAMVMGCNLGKLLINGGSIKC
jgi:hypothetical protein